VLCEIVDAVFLDDTTEGWLERLRAADILADRINGFDDWLTGPHVVATAARSRLISRGSRNFVIVIRERQGLRPVVKLQWRQPVISASTERRSLPNSGSDRRQPQDCAPKRPAHPGAVVTGASYPRAGERRGGARGQPDNARRARLPFRLATNRKPP
jgi:hypothetical protein